MLSSLLLDVGYVRLSVIIIFPFLSENVLTWPFLYKKHFPYYIVSK